MALCFLLPLYMASSSTQQASPVPLLTTQWEFYPSLKIKFQSLFPQWLQPTVISTPFELCIVNRYSKYCSISTHESLPLRTLFSRRKKRAKKYTQNKLFCLFFSPVFCFRPPASAFLIFQQQNRFPWYFLDIPLWVLSLSGYSLEGGKNKKQNAIGHCFSTRGMSFLTSLAFPSPPTRPGQLQVFP